MSWELISQYALNTIMLAIIYGLVAAGFSLYFGVLNVIQFAHGDMLTVSCFVALIIVVALQHAGVSSPAIQLLIALFGSVGALVVIGIVVAKCLVIPLRRTPLNVLLITLMFGTMLREMVRLFFPDGSSPHAFPMLLPRGGWSLHDFSLPYSDCIILGSGLAIIAAIHFFISHTKLGLAVRGVEQDSETASTMGVDVRKIIFLTFAMGGSMAALAGLGDVLYYNQLDYDMGLTLGIIGFTAAIIGGLDNIYGAILGGVLFAALQTIGAVALPIPSDYKDAFAFGIAIIIMAFRPTGLLGERNAERV